MRMRPQSMWLWALCLCVLCGNASGQYRIISSLGVGSVGDIVARTFAGSLQSISGKSAVVETRIAAAGLQALVGAPPDGQTFLLMGPVVVTMTLGADPGGLEQIQGVSLVGITGMGIVVNPGLGVADIAGLTALAKGRTLRFGTPGVGTLGETCSRQFLASTGGAGNMVPFASPMLLNAIAANNAEVACVSMQNLAPMVSGNRVKLLAVTTPFNHPAFPGIPTLESTSVNGVVYGEWLALVALRAVDRSALQLVVGAVKAMVERADVVQKLRSFGFEAIPAQDVGPDVADGYVRRQVRVLAPYAFRR